MMTTPPWSDPAEPNDDFVRDGSTSHGSPQRPTSRAVSHRQIDEIKRRLRSGAYDTPEVVDALARRLIERGEL